jgi:hypothetical protein
MAVVYDSSTPAHTYTGFVGTATTTVVTNSFSPPSDSVLVVVIEASESYNETWNIPTVTDSLGSPLTWSIAASQADSTSSFGAVWVAWAACPTAQTNMTVSVGLGVGAGQYISTAVVAPIVVTGAYATAPIANINQGISATQAASFAMSPIYSGSALFMVTTRMTGTATIDTAGTGLHAQVAVAAGAAAYDVAFLGTAGTFTASTASTPITLALNTADTGNTWQWIAFEVTPPHGTLAAGTGWVIGSVAF